MALFSSTLAPKSKKFSELLAILSPQLRKDTKIDVPEPGAPSPPIPKANQRESSDFLVKFGNVSNLSLRFLSTTI